MSGAYHQPARLASRSRDRVSPFLLFLWWSVACGAGRLALAPPSWWSAGTFRAADGLAATGTFRAAGGLAANGSCSGVATLWTFLVDFPLETTMDGSGAGAGAFLPCKITQHVTDLILIIRIQSTCRTRTSRLQVLQCVSNACVHRGHKILCPPQ